MAANRYAVIGHPVAHSLSPIIHARFAAETGEDMEYDRLEAPVDGFAATARSFFDGGGRGLNVTVPFKAEAFEWCDERSARADRAGAVNTLSVAANQRILGDNTDGVGLVRDVRDNLGLPIAQRRVLLVGAGGAARGTLGPLLAEGPAQLTVANRTADRAHALAAEFAGDGPIAGRGFDQLAAAEPFDLIVNASAASLAGELPPLPPALLAVRGSVYDMMYGDAAHAFLEWGRAAGAATAADGLGMLVEQAAESFYVWRGVRPQTTGVLTHLRATGGR